MDDEDRYPDEADAAAEARGEAVAEEMDARKRTATELALLTMLGDRVKAEADARRATIANTWAGKDVVNLELPNEANPSRPIKVGTIRADGGQGVAKVSDREAWVEWCRQNVPHNVVHQPAGATSWQLDDASRSALSMALFEAKVVADTGGFGADPASAALAVLEQHGYTLTKVQPIPEVTEVRQVWESETLKLTQEAGEPVCPGGLIPDGIEFVPPSKVVKPVVTIGRDDATREAFVRAHRAMLPALAGGLTLEVES